jgi:hypothetical protein
MAHAIASWQLTPRLSHLATPLFGRRHIDLLLVCSSLCPL